MSRAASICPFATACDLARQTLALAEAELLERLGSVEADRDVYRALLREALAGWHATVTERDRLRRRCTDQQAQIRALLGAAPGAPMTRRRVA